MFHRLMCWLLSGSVFLFAVSPGYARAFSQIDDRQNAPAAAGRTTEEAEHFLREFMALVEELRSHIDRSQFDLKALLRKLGFDAERIIEFVREDIAFEQYPGLLRGPEGALMSRAGNALDQSMLLASLLKDASYEARILRARVDVAQSRALLDQMFEPRAPLPPIGDVDQIRSVMVKLARLSGVPEAELQRILESGNRPSPSVVTPLQNEAGSDAQFIIDALDKAGVAMGDPDIQGKLTQEARDYFWVEYREGPAAEWQAVHPAFGDPGIMLQDLSAQQTFADQIPEELQHRFRFRAYVEQKTAGMLTESPVMDAWERPVANMVGKTLTYANLPANLRSTEDLLDLRELMADNRMFVPYFGGAAAGESAFDLSGRMMPLDAAMSDYAGVFETAADKTSKAISAMDSMNRSETGQEADESPMALSAHWLEFTLIRPDGTEVKIRRPLMDRIAPDERDSGGLAVSEMSALEMNQSIASFQSFMVAAGAFPQALTFDLALQRLIAMEPTIHAVMLEQAGQALPEDDSGSGAEPSYPFELAQLAFYQYVDQQVPREVGSVNYRGAPSLIVQTKRLSGDYNTVSSFDIIANSRRAFTRMGDEIAVDTYSGVFSGALETRAETLLHARVDRNSGKSLNTVEVFREAKAIGLPIKVLKPGSEGALTEVRMTESARSHVSNDLESGYVAIIPEKPPAESQDYFGWWRVDPVSGETLGMISSGLGGDVTVEYEIQLKTPMMILSIAMTGLGGIAGYAVCTQQAPHSYTTGQVAACCLADMVIGSTIAFLSGLAVGAYVGALAGFLLMDFVGGFVQLAGDIWDLIPSMCNL